MVAFVPALPDFSDVALELTVLGQCEMFPLTELQLSSFNNFLKHLLLFLGFHSDLGRRKRKHNFMMLLSLGNLTDIKFVASFLGFS